MSFVFHSKKKSSENKEEVEVNSNKKSYKSVLRDYFLKWKGEVVEKAFPYPDTLFVIITCLSAFIAIIFMMLITQADESEFYPISTLGASAVLMW